MPCSGVPGTWAITWNRTVSTYPTNQVDSVSGFADDNPYLADSGGIRSLISACDGRNISTWCFASSGCYIVSAVFTPDQAPQVDYDCINGACTPKTTYNTPGLYSLSECETACGTGCSGKCIANSDWAVIEGLANQLKQRNCI